MKQIDDLAAALDLAAPALKAGYIEILSVVQNNITAAFSKQYEDSVKWLPYDSIKSIIEIKAAQPGKLFKFTQKSGTDDIHYVAIVAGKIPSTAIILIQSKFPYDKSAEMLLTLSATASAYSAELGLKASDGDKYKKDLQSMRHIQAMLFPKFSDTPGLDIGAVYLPAQYISGNFVDAMFLSDELYQVSVCTIEGYDATSSFVGSAVRTLVRSMSSPQLIPSSLVEVINRKLQKIVSGVNYLMNMTVYQINIRTGKISISSFGPLSTLYYITKKKSTIKLDDTSIGKDLAKRVTFKDISFIMDPGDALLYYSPGVISAETEDGKAKYGETSLFNKFKGSVDMKSSEHVRSISESIFEFTNFSTLKDDVLIVKIRKE